MKRTCWICALPADSSEHIFKKSDLVRIHGAGPYKDENKLLHLKEGVFRDIQGPKSDVVKYEKSLCQHCNNTFTQPFDLAYDKFISWVMSNEDIIVRRRLINFKDIYGDDFEDCQRNLFKYYAKSLGCRIIDAGYEVPDDLKELLYLERFTTGLRIQFAVNEDMLPLQDDMRMGLAKGDLLGIDPHSNLPSFIWKESLKWFNVFYWYNYFPKTELGCPWIADSQHIHLGTYAPLDKTLHSKLIQDMATFDRFWIEGMKKAKE